MRRFPSPQKALSTVPVVFQGSSVPKSADLIDLRINSLVLASAEVLGIGTVWDTYSETNNMFYWHSHRSVLKTILHLYHVKLRINSIIDAPIEL